MRAGRPGEDLVSVRCAPMLVCDAPEFVHWRPDFSSSGQTEPDWTQVRCGGHQLTNGCEWVDWDQDPVQVVLCEACGVTDCEWGGYVHVARVGGHVLWSAPRLPVSDDETFDREQYRSIAAIDAHGAVAIPAAVWERWPGVPAIASLPPARRGDLLAAWRAGAPPHEEAVAADGGTVEEALAVDRWFESDEPVGALVPLGEGAITLFYDGARFTEWIPAARVGERLVPVFAGRLIPQPTG